MCDELSGSPLPPCLAPGHLNFEAIPRNIHGPFRPDIGAGGKLARERNEPFKAFAVACFDVIDQRGDLGECGDKFTLKEGDFQARKTRRSVDRAPKS